MKKRTKVLILSAILLIIFAGIYGCKMYKMVFASEELSGKVANVPDPVKNQDGVKTGDFDWPNWRGPSFDGKSSIKGIKTDWSKGLVKIWEVDFLCQDNLSASWSAPVIKGSRLIVPGRAGSEDIIFCLDAKSGNLLWKKTYESHTTTYHGSGPRASAVIENDKVYTFGRAGDLACWDLADGKENWRKNVTQDGGSEPKWGYSGSPYILGNRIFVQGGGKALFLAYDKTNGRLLWKQGEGEAGYATIISMKIDTVTCLLVYHGTGLSCINPGDGRVLWNIPWETSYNVNAATPIVDGDLVFHTANYGMGSELVKAGLNGYSIVWKNNVINAQHSDLLLVDGYLYGFTEEGNERSPFKCVDFKTGTEKWSTNEIPGGTCIFADNHLICLDVKGNLYLVKPDHSKFILESKMPSAIPDVKHYSWTSPVIADDKLYLRYLQTLICYSLK